jgi:tetratricopeptide (TPR) repeat protein
MKQVYLILLLVLFLLFVNAQKNSSVDIDTTLIIAERLLNSNPQKSLELAEKVEQQAKAAKYAYGINKAEAIKGVAFYKVDQYEKAGRLFSTTAKQSAESKDTVNLCYTTYWQGNLQLHAGNYSKALDLYQEVFNLATASGDKQNLARALDGKASIYEALNETEKAAELYEQSLQIATESGFTDWIPTVTFSLANIEYRKGNKAAATAKYKEAIRLSEIVGNLNNKANCLQQLASISYEENQLKQAMEYIREAMDIFKQTGSESSYSYSRLLMSAILLKEKDWDLAAQLAQNSLQEGKAKKETALQRDAAEILYYAYLGKGNTAKALDFHVLFHQLSEKEHNEELTKKLTQMELQSNFESERTLQKAIQEKEKAELNSQLEKQKLTQKAALVGFIFIAIIAGLAIFAFVQKRKDTRLVAAEKVKSDLVLAALLPHDLFKEVKTIRNSEEHVRHTVLFADLKTDSVETRKIFEKTFTEVLKKHHLKQVNNHEGLYIAISMNDVPEKHMAQNVIRAGIELIELVRLTNTENATNKPVEAGVGVHTGLIIADVLGLKTSEHNIWGDTISTAARIEQHGMRNKVNISSETYELVKDDFKCVRYGNLPITEQLELGIYFIDLS